ncbi:MAG: YitT family protein [Velocimicrobium sp.]
MRIKAKKSLIVIIGSMLMALGINFFFEPMKLVTGGVSGFAIIVKGLTTQIMQGGIPVWLTNLIINVFLFLGSYRILGKQFLKNTIIGTLVFTGCLYLVPVMDLARGDLLLAAIFGSVLSGAGLGLIFSAGASSGGTDLLGAILHRFFRHYSVAQMLLVVDGMIVLLGALVYGIDVALYAVIAVFITTKVMDAILEGLKFAKLALIISAKDKEISEEILYKMGRGVTVLPVKGAYSNDNKNMLLCAVDKKEIVALMDIVDKNDPRAFMIVTDAREVLGEGFIEYRQ